MAQSRSGWVSQLPALSQLSACPWAFLIHSFPLFRFPCTGAKHEYLGEPIFVPRAVDPGSGHGEEDAGYVLTLLNNGKDKKSEFLIFDAQSISKGPICRLPISSNIPFGLHGTWAEGLVWGEEEITRKWKAAFSIDNKNWNEVKSDFSGLGISF